MLRDILTAEGDTPEGGGTETPPAATPPTTSTTPTTPAPSWYAQAESLKTSHPEIWQTFENGIKTGAIKDLPSLIIKGIGAEKKLGLSLTMPNKDNPQEVKSFKLKLSEAGILPSTPAKPEDYQINLDAIPEPLRSQELVGTVRQWAHKHGLSAEAVTELMGIEAQRYKQTIEPALRYTQEQGQQAIKDLATELGKEPNVVEQWVGQWLHERSGLSEEEMAALEHSGVANSPAHLKLIAKAGRDTGEDISVNADGVSSLTDAVMEEILSVTSNANHPMHQLWLRGSPEDPKRIEFMEKLDAARKKKYGTTEVE